MNCRELVELVTDLVEGALPPERVREVRDHLADCVDCLRYFGQMQLTRRLLAQLGQPSAAAGAAVRPPG